MNPRTFSREQVIAVSVSTRSTVEDPVVLAAQTAQANATYPNPVIIFADLTKGERRVAGASVVATISLPNNRIIIIDLIDNGNCKYKLTTSINLLIIKFHFSSRLVQRRRNIRRNVYQF